jgi:hypothetical protein
MFSPHMSFQDIFFPLQQLTYFQAKLDLCHRMLTQLQYDVPTFLPGAADTIASTAHLLQPTQNQIAVIEYQMWQISQMQLQYHLHSSGRLPPLDAD